MGIDLGTTNSLVARVDEDGNPIMVVDGEGTRILPSVIAFDGSEVSSVGEKAREVLPEKPPKCGVFREAIDGQRR